MSGWCLDGVSGCLGCMNTKSIHKMLYKVMELRYCLFFQCPILHKTPITGGVWVVSGRVCLVSGMCLWTEEVSGCSNTKSIDKIWIRPYLDIALSSSTLYCIKCLCLGVSGWCLDDVYMVSEEASIPNLLANKYIRSWCSYIAFSSSARYCIKMPVLGCLNCVWECLDGVWGCLRMY